MIKSTVKEVLDDIKNEIIRISTQEGQREQEDKTGSYQKEETTRSSSGKSKVVRYIDLFCGLGAFHAAFNRVNNDYGEEDVDKKYECVLACDIDEGIRSIYEENYGIKPEGDINKICIEEVPDFDILCAGFPCQSFSIAGKKQGLQDDSRGSMFFKILDIVDAKCPPTIFLENVKNLLTIDNGKTFAIMKSELEKRDYHVSYKVIDSRFYNSPQSRQRLYIICNKDNSYKFQMVVNPIVPVSSIIEYNTNDYLDYEEKYTLEKCEGKRTSSILYKLINKETGKGGRQGERVYDIHSFGPTICASSGGPGAKTGLYYLEEGKIRTLSIVETLRMFGFEDSFKYESLKNKNKMLYYLGNSIVVNVIEQLIRDL